MSSALYRAAIAKELARFCADWQPTELWWLHAGEYSPEALTTSRHALTSGNFGLLAALPRGGGLTDNLELVFFRAPQLQLMAALVLDPFELWDSLRVLEIHLTTNLPVTATLLL